LKQESITALITAKTLFETASDMCQVNDSHVASAGLVVLQDALELIFLASLIEIGIDESKSLENFTFNQLIGELKSNKVTVPKTGTIKALNKERVIVKHYGQLSEPATVKNYLSAAQICTDEVLKQIFTRSLSEIWLHEFLTNEETKQCFASAISNLEKGELFDALVEIRKAIFIEIESDYSIYDWRDVTSAEKSKMGLLLWGKGGHKAPYYTKNKEWIEKNIKDPFDFIQLDHQQMRSDLLEWGVNTQDFWNLWRLTPTVFRETKEYEWKIKKEAKYYLEGATQENVRYCLDKAINLIVKKRNHFDLIRNLEGNLDNSFEVVTISEPTPVFKKATSSSEQSFELEKGLTLVISSVVQGLDEEGTFLNIFYSNQEQKRFVYGYVKAADCELKKE